MARAKLKPVKTDIDGAKSMAFSEIDSIKDELQSWYDNLPESFQNGDKGSALQEAVDALEQDSEPDCPDVLDGIECEYSEYVGHIGRPKRRDTAVNAIRAAVDAARNRASELEELSFNDDGVLLIDGEAIDVDEYEGDLPCTESERDDAVTEIESFAEECENAADNWENVEFPGMYG